MNFNLKNTIQIALAFFALIMLIVSIKNPVSSSEVFASVITGVFKEFTNLVSGAVNFFGSIL